MNINDVHIAGILSDQPLVNQSASGKSYAKQAISVSEDIGHKVATHYIKCTFFGELAEKLSRYNKGDKIDIQGKISNSSYVNKKGDKVYTTDIIVYKINSSIDANNTATQKESLEELPELPALNDEDIPW
jgi:single-strand DNA-binding protein